MAEVLITLGIIGVVAALTIPSLIQKYEKQVTASRVKQAYSMIAQAIKLSEIENGRVEDWVVSTSDKGLAYTEKFMNKFLLPYLKAEYCGEGLTDDVIEKCGAHVSRFGKNYILANGVATGFVPSLAFESPRNEVLYVVIDTNGPKKPNVMGIDQFYFQYYINLGFKPYGTIENCSRDSILNGTCISGESKVACMSTYTQENLVSNRDGCALLLMMDGWKFKEDYPWKPKILE